MAINCRLSIIVNIGKCILMFLNKDIFLFLSLKKEKSSRVHIYFFIKDLYTKCTHIYKYNVVFCTYDKVALLNNICKQHLLFLASTIVSYMHVAYLMT